MFAKHIPINGPVSKIHKEPLKLNSKKKKISPVRKWTKDTDISLKIYRWKINTWPKSPIASAIEEK